MSELINDLLEIESELRNFIDKNRRPEIEELLQKLRDAAEEAGKAWSGSCLGYQANVYYAGFKPPPTNAHFSPRWGLPEVSLERGTLGDWRQYNPEEVRTLIHSAAGTPDLTLDQELAKVGRILFDDKRSDIISILEVALADRKDPFIKGLKEQTENEQIVSESDFFDPYVPSKFRTADLVALDQGIRVPAHLSVSWEVLSLQDPADKCEDLADIARRAAAHLRRVEKNVRCSDMIGKNVFIGHGGSLLWRELKDFITERLKLPCDEFQRVSPAGKTTIDRLEEMLADAAIAFLIMTGEDEQADGKLHARLNVVHEAGLFQGRLGFTRAIVLLEEGCEQFSNIHGLGQIRFPKGNLKAAFEEVRQVLEREGVIES